jgi:hypothetical protein
MTRPWISEEQDRKAIEQWKRRHNITSLVYLMEYDALGELGRKELGAIIRHFFLSTPRGPGKNPRPPKPKGPTPEELAASVRWHMDLAARGLLSAKFKKKTPAIEEVCRAYRVSEKTVRNAYETLAEK